MPDLKNVVVDYGDKRYAVGSVEVSDNPSDEGRREENVMFGMFAVRECFRYWNPVKIDDDGNALLRSDSEPLPRSKPLHSPQERFLIVVRAIAATISGKRRDEPLERAILDDWMGHFGLGEFARLMGQPEHADQLDPIHLANHIRKHQGEDAAKDFVREVTRSPDA